MGRLKTPSGVEMLQSSQGLDVTQYDVILVNTVSVQSADFVHQQVRLCCLHMCAYIDCLPAQMVEREFLSAEMHSSLPKLPEALQYTCGCCAVPPLEVKSL